MGSGASSSKGKPTFYYFPLSAPCRAVMMTAKSINLQMDMKKVDLMKGEQKEAEFLKINPDHTVPTLVDGSLRLWESRAIMQYLVDKYAPNNPLYPRDPVKRAPVDRMLQYDISNSYRYVGAYIYPQVFESKPADPEAAKKVEETLDYLESILKAQPYIAADHLTIADLSITANLSMLEIKQWDFDKWPKVVSWRGAIRKEMWYEDANAGLVAFLKASS